MSEPDSSETPRAHILIVDDSPANLGVLQGVLEEAGFHVLVATSGERALTRLTYMQPDLILLDINMPGLDGYETCRRMKDDPRWQDVPVLFLTARDVAEDKMRGFEAGAVDYITKPLHAEEVLARVRAHLKIRFLQQALAEKNELLETAMARRLEAEAQLQQSLDRAVLVVDPEGGVEFCTRLARRLLDRYFPAHTDAANLPPALCAWLATAPPAGPWTAEQRETRLEVRRFIPDHPEAPLVLVLEEKMLGTHSPTRLLPLGLTQSEAEALYWVAHGKSNQEVAVILGKTLNTIKKHVANLIVKMGVENRLMAAIHAAEILELKSVDPETLLAIREQDQA